MIEEYASGKKFHFVYITDLSGDSTNMEIGNFEHKGVASHPSDKGMRMIGERIWSLMKGYSKNKFLSSEFKI